MENCRPIRPLPIFSKVFEKDLFNSLFSHFYNFYNNNLFTKYQPGFMLGDSCSFDRKPPIDVRAIFLDISKSLWWSVASLFRHLENYFNIRKQIVVLDGQCSSWKIILYGGPQGSVLGPLLTLIYINDLPNGLVPICKVFADDTSVFSKVFGKNKSQRNLNDGLFINE